MVTYEDAGINIAAADGFKEIIPNLVESTWNKPTSRVTKTKGFASMLRFPQLAGPYYFMESVDGVGTKTIVACKAKQWDMLGIDAVAANVNDLVVYGGAEILTFNNYLSVGKHKTDEKKIDLMGIVRGMAIGCDIAGCSLTTGETAELPGILKEDALDVVGTAAGIISIDRMVGQIKEYGAVEEWFPYNINSGDVIIGLPSSGIHCNGYSLARSVFFGEGKKTIKFSQFESNWDSKTHRWAEPPCKSGDNIHEWIPEFCCSIGEELLKPTRIYSNIINQLIDEFGTASKVNCMWTNNCRELKYQPKQGIKGIAHITGSGFNKILKVIPDDQSVEIKKGTWPILPVFKYIQEKGNISEEEMFKTFNMGIGMVLIADEALAPKVISSLKEKNAPAYLIGHIVQKKVSERKVYLSDNKNRTNPQPKC